MIYMEQKPGQLGLAPLCRGRRVKKVKTPELDSALGLLLCSLRHWSGSFMPVLENQPSSHAVAEVPLGPRLLLIQEFHLEVLTEAIL